MGICYIDSVKVSLNSIQWYRTSSRKKFGYPSEYQKEGCMDRRTDIPITTYPQLKFLCPKGLGLETGLNVMKRWKDLVAGKLWNTIVQGHIHKDISGTQEVEAWLRLTLQMRYNWLLLSTSLKFISSPWRVAKF